MARSINQVILMGRLTRDPEQRTTTTGKTIASFSIAVDRGGQEDAADFFNVTAWEKLGDLVMQYLAKGRRVLVQGPGEHRQRKAEHDQPDGGAHLQRRHGAAVRVVVPVLRGDEVDGHDRDPVAFQNVIAKLSMTEARALGDAFHARR